MKTIFLVVAILTFFSQLVCAEPSKADLLRFFETWEKTNPSSGHLIKYVRIKDMLTPSSVEPDEIDDTFIDGIYEHIINDADLVALADIDGDGIAEAFILLIQGSGHFPLFQGFKKEPTSGKYRRILSVERNIELADLGGHLYFVEALRDFNSGRLSKYNIIHIKSTTEMEVVAKISKTYIYNLEPDVRRFISSRELNHIAAQDYSFLGIKTVQPTDFSLSVNNKTFQAHIRWTSVGYYATTVDLIVCDTTGMDRTFEHLWGFSVATLEDGTYLCTLAMDDVNRISAIQDFRINVYRIEDWKVVASQFATAIEVTTVE